MYIDAGPLGFGGQSNAVLSIKIAGEEPPEYRLASGRLFRGLFLFTHGGGEVLSIVREIGGVRCFALDEATAFLSIGIRADSQQ
jgi:hypothetical protein